jgi:hypothetical protein
VDLSIFDSAGLEYLRSRSASPEQSFNFTVVGGLPIGVTAYVREDAKFNLSYSGYIISNSTEGSPGVAVRNYPGIWSGFLILVVYNFFL